MSTEVSILNDHGLSVVLSSQNDVAWKKASSSVHSSNNCTNAFFGTALACRCAAEVLYAYHHLHKILKRWALKGQDLMKLNTF